MKKFDRVISTLVLLQTKKTIKAKTMSERFDISLRTVYRDISTLKNAGIPIIGDPGIGYSIMDGYRLPPIAFNERETAALLTAEKFIDLDGSVSYSDSISVQVVISGELIQISPNPVAQTISIQGLNQDRPYEIYNATGKLVLSGRTSNLQIDISNLTKSVYILQLETDSGKVSKKVVKK